MSALTAVRIGGETIGLGGVEATGTIRHGRSEPDDPPTSSTATVTLIGGSWPARLEAGMDLELDADGEPRFRGQITDLAIGWASARLTPADPILAELQVTAAGNLARIARTKVGYGDWPAEGWSDRVARVMDEAGWTAYAIDTVVDATGHDVLPAYPLAARLAGETTVHAALEDLATTGDAAIVDTPDGTILFSALESRDAFTSIRLLLDTAEVLFAPDWTQTLDVINSVSVAYGPEEDSHTVTTRNVESVERFGERTADVASTYASADAAAARGMALVTRRGYPRWQLPGCGVLALLTPTIGQPILLNDLPENAPAAGRRFVALLEGWADVFDAPARWVTQLALSHPALSGSVLPWAWVPIPPFRWQDVAPTCRWIDAYQTENLAFGPP